MITLPARVSWCISCSRTLLSPLINLEYVTEDSCRKTVELYLPREKDPDDCIKYVWINIIWRSNQNVNFTTGKKSNWLHVPGFCCSPGVTPSIWSSWKPGRKTAAGGGWNVLFCGPCLALTELLNSSKCCPFLFVALPFSELHNNKRRGQVHL